MSEPLARLQRAIRLIAAAFGAAAAVRVHHRPADSQLERLGIRAKDFPKAW